MSVLPPGPHPPLPPPPPPPSSLLDKPPPFPSHPPGKPGLCGLTSDQWHIVLILLLILLFAFLIGFVVASVQSERISQLWLRVQGQAEVTRMALHEQLFKRLLSENDIRNPLITPGSSIDQRNHPIVNFILSALFSSLRGQGR
ncbi:hypothetical protein BGW80DRAFT_1463798 [Lactifluus volemus]|nr:hypothetical protein BGW80DRAFT_1463798 [Lactifluus volemus]